MPHSLSYHCQHPPQQTTLMQVAPPCHTTTAMWISTSAMPTYSSQEASGLTSAAEDELLKGATLPCSPWWEASLMNMTTPVELMENHRKMMDALRCLDTYSLQFCCESVQAHSWEWTPVRVPPGYLTPQASGAPLAHEFYRATNNLGTAIVAPLPAATQQPLAEAPICHPDPEIEVAVINMECHEKASRDNNPR